MNYIPCIISAILAFFVTAAMGPIAIPFLKRLKFGQNIRGDGPNWHANKSGTPTMGGFIFIIGITVTVIALSFIGNIKSSTNLIYTLLMPLFFAFIGFIDDWTKVKKKQNMGLTVRQKFILQVIVAIAYLVSMYMAGNTTSMTIPFINWSINFGWLYYPIAVILIVGTVNAVNLTDGIDGLASSISLITAIAFGTVSVILLNSEIGIFASALAGGMIGFLIYNFYPAKVFMGDTGSLFLGGALAAMAFGLRQPLLIIVIGAVFILEMLSVVVQVFYFKITNGKRLFKMSPIHHHFELCGWSEIKIVTVFSLVTIVASVLGIISAFGIFK